MKAVAVTDTPPSSFLRPYADRNAYTDGYACDLPVTIDLAAFIRAFYTSWPFRLERLILALLVAKPSTDAEVEALAAGQRQRFAAWTVEARTADQILMCDYLSKTRSWLMCLPMESGGTRLYFGSAIVPERIQPDGRVDLGAGFHALLGFHKVYSVVLLRAAAARVIRRASKGE